MALTEKQEKFCQLKAENDGSKKDWELYKSIYNCNDTSAYNLAYNLMKNVEIIERIEEIQADLFRVAKVDFSKRRFMRELVYGLELAKEKQNLLGMAQCFSLLR